MKKKVLRVLTGMFFLIISIFVLFFAYILVQAALLINLQRGPQIIEPVYSPSGKMVMTPTRNENKEDVDHYHEVVMVVRDVETGKVLLEAQTDAASRLSWDVRWIDEDTIQLLSSDIGGRCWKREADTSWQEASCPK
jgi:hypothetical protein